MIEDPGLSIENCQEWPPQTPKIDTLLLWFGGDTQPNLGATPGSVCKIKNQAKCIRCLGYLLTCFFIFINIFNKLFQ